MSGNSYTVGQELAFYYNDKQRLVEVVKVRDSYITAKSLNVTETEEYKTYTISKMQSVVHVKK